MADGQVLIESKLDSSGVQRGTNEIKQDLSGVAKAASKAADAMQNELKGVNLDGIADGMSESFGSESAAIKAIMADTAADSRTKAMRIAAEFKAAGMDSSTAMKQAWQIVKSESASGSRKVVDDLDDIGDKAESVGGSIASGIGGAFSKLAATAAVYLGAEEIAEAGLYAIQTAADIRAENAQFTQTFKALQSQATESLNVIAKETGITATRMRKAYTSVFAFSKSVGVDEAQALDIANRAMVVAADSAAYYDRSLEETTETLQSFLKGNYENDAALGFAATETTRNAKANELYAKSFDKLTEAQKVDVLLAMVEAANEASGALGQAALEANAWTNVTGELKEAWRQFVAVMGEPIMDYVTPIVQNVTTLLQNLPGMIENFSFSDLFGDIDIAPMAESISAFTASAMSLADSLNGPLKSAYDGVLVPLATWTIEEGLPASLSAIASGIEANAAAIEWLAPLGDHLITNYIQPLGEITGMGIGAALSGIADGFTALKDAIEGFDVSSVDVFERISNAIQETFFPGLADPLVQGFGDTTTAAGEAEGAIDNVGGATETVRDTGKAAFGALCAEIVAAMIEAYNGASEQTQEIQAAIDAIQGKTIYVDILPRIGAAIGNTGFGTNGYVPEFSSYAPSYAYEVPTQIPYLATGAVIPPNAPFMAVLGDQRSGTNLEAPEELIRKIVREETESSIETNVNINWGGSLAGLGRVLQPVIAAETKRKGKNLSEEVAL